MSNDNEWDKLIQAVEREQAARGVQDAPRELVSGLGMYEGRRMPPVVPNVLPAYIAKPAAARRKWAALWGFLKVSFGLVIILGGSYYLWQKYRAPLGDSAVRTVDNETSTASQHAPVGGISGGDGFRNARENSEYRTSIQSALEGRLRPVDLIESIYGKQKVDWLKVSSMNLPKDGKPLIVFAVLYARLDDDTEKRWHDAGLFNNEGVVPTPFIRKITISNREGLDLLLDWHVEGILANNPLKQAK